MKNYSPTIIEDMLPEASGVYNVGSKPIPFASGYFDGLDAGSANIRSIDGTLNAPIINLGSISGSRSLSADTMYEAVLTGATTLTLPSTTDGFLSNIMFQFTMASSYTVTVPDSVTWNFSSSPTLATTKRNRMIFDTIDGGTTWNGYFSQF